MKSFSFLFITIFAALVIAGTAALFSVTGISTIFSAHFIQVAIMAGSLELGKIVIASILYRYWKLMNKAIKTYMLIALLVLMGITSAGIFGYLSEAYQKTKGSYDVVDKEIMLLDNKKELFQNEYERYQKRVNDLISIRTAQESRLDSLYARNYITAAKRVEIYIKQQDNEISELNKKLLVVTDSLSNVEKQILIKQSMNITGELGPLQYVANAIGATMDTTVKYFILLLIFVFDPLAVTLIVAANIIYVNKHYEREEWIGIFNKKKQHHKVQHKEKLNLMSLEALPVDKNAKMIETISNKEEVKEDKPDVKTDEQNDKTKENIPEKNYKWKSANWIESFFKR